MDHPQSTEITGEHQNAYLDQESIEAIGHAAAGEMFAGILSGATSIGLGIAKSMLGVVEFMSKLTQVYAPEDPTDVFTEQHKQLQKEVVHTSNELSSSLDFIRNHPVLFGKKIIMQTRDSFIEGTNDFIENVNQSKYYAAGEKLGKLGSEAYFLGTGLGCGYNISKAGLLFSSKVVRVGFNISSSSSMWLYHSISKQGIVKTISPSAIKFSQSSVNDLKILMDSMQKSGWKWTKSPIDIVRMQDGSLVTLDNTRVLAAHEVGINVRAIIRNANDPLPKNLIKRFKTKKDGDPQTWGEAIKFRINNQNKAFKVIHPSGSKFTGLSSKS